MSEFHYVVFHHDTYNTSVPYTRNLMVLGKADILAAADHIGLKLSKSHTKQELADELSEYVRKNAQSALSRATDEQIILLKELTDAGPNTILWKRHLHKYDFLKRMVWVVVNYDRQGKKDGFVLVDELREAFAPVIEERVESAQKQVAENKQLVQKKRIALKDIQQMMDGMNLELAEKIHYLFMANHIDYNRYDFRDEWEIDGYVWCYNDFFESGDKRLLKSLNGYVLSILDEWRQDTPSRYRNAKEDISYWITCRWLEFNSPMKDEIVQAWEAAALKDNGQAIALALSPFPPRALERMGEKSYEEAAGILYCVFDCLAKTNKKHKAWYEGFLGGGEYSDLAVFTEAVVELYCHLRQLPDIPTELGDEMNIRLEIFGKKTWFFGDMMYDSRISDMECDAKNQFGDYTNIEDCTMWKYWYTRKLPELKRDLTNDETHDR